MHTPESRRQFSRVGLAVFSVTAVTYGLQLVLLPLVLAVWPQFQEHPWFTWLASSLPLYLCGFPCAWLILRPSHKSVTRPGPLPSGSLAAPLQPVMPCSWAATCWAIC